MATHSSTLAGKSHGQRSLVGYSPRGRKQSDTTERLQCVCERLHGNRSVFGWPERSYNCSKFFSILYFSSVTTESFLRDMRARFCMKETRSHFVLGTDE